MNCKRKTIPKECVETILSEKSPFYLDPVQMCVGCRNEEKPTRRSDCPHCGSMRIPNVSITWACPECGNERQPRWRIR